MPEQTPPSNTAKVPLPLTARRSVRWLAAIVSVGVIVSLGVVTYRWYAKKAPATAKPSALPEQGSLVDASNVKPNQQVGESKIDTDCYSFTLPRSSSLASNFGCEVELSYGSSDQNQLVISAVPQTAGADGRYDLGVGYQAYRASQLQGFSLVSEEAFSLAGQSAHKLIIQDGQGMSYIRFFAGPKKQSVTTRSGEAVIALGLAAPYNSTEQTQSIDALLSSWQWR